MQKFIRIAMVALLVVVTIAIILSQTSLYRQQHATMPLDKAMVQLVQGPPAAAGSAPVVSSGLSPADIAREAAEREKDREIARAIEHDLNRLTASSLAQNYLMLFQAIIYFLTLVIIFSLLETVKKFAEAASKSAEAARVLAEAGGKGGEVGGHCKKHHNHGHRDVNKFLMRRLRGNYRKQ